MNYRVSRFFGRSNFFRVMRITVPTIVRPFDANIAKIFSKWLTRNSDVRKRFGESHHNLLMPNFFVFTYMNEFRSQKHKISRDSDGSNAVACFPRENASQKASRYILNDGFLERRKMGLKIWGSQATMIFFGIIRKDTASKVLQRMKRNTGERSMGLKPK